MHLKLLFLGTFDGNAEPDLKRTASIFDIMPFIFPSKEHITVYGVFIVLFGYLNIFRSAMK